MIRSKDLNLEINALKEKMEKGDVSQADVLKALLLIVKVVRDIKTNQVIELTKKYGRDVLIKEIKREKPNEEKKQ